MTPFQGFIATFYFYYNHTSLSGLQILHSQKMKQIKQPAITKLQPPKGVKRL